MSQTGDEAPLLTLLKETKQVQQEVKKQRREEKKISKITTLFVAMNQSKGNLFFALKNAEMLNC